MNGIFVFNVRLIKLKDSDNPLIIGGCEWTVNTFPLISTVVAFLTGRGSAGPTKNDLSTTLPSPAKNVNLLKPPLSSQTFLAPTLSQLF